MITAPRAASSVADGAALVLKQDADGNSLNVAYNMRLAGTGINHRFAWLNQMGALVNLQGSNVATGPKASTS